MKIVTKALNFVPAKKRTAFTGRPSILEVALANEVALNHSCGGMGSCTTCRVFISLGAEKLLPRNELEAEHAQLRGFADNERLACQTEALDGLTIVIPADD